MAVCTTQQIQDQAGCFLCLSDRTLEAIKTYALYKEAAALGYDVDASIDGIIQSASCQEYCQNERTILAAEAAILVAKANLGGAAIPTTAAELAGLVSSLELAGGLRGAQAAVLCTMKQHAAGP